MEDLEIVEENRDPAPSRRSLRLALSEINESSPAQNQNNTPNKNTSPEEILVIQRGPRRKPVTWSPVEYSRTRLLGPPKDVTPEKTPQIKGEIVNSRLRKRLIMSPIKSPSQDLGMAIAKKLRSMKNLQKTMVKNN